MRLMYDSTDAFAIPAGAEMIAAYFNGKYANLAQVRVRFPHADIVTVTVMDAAQADVLDVEARNASPAQAAGWIRAMHSAGYQRPTVYCSLATVPAVREATGILVAGVDYDVWAADWTGSAHEVVLPGPGQHAVAAAVQYENTPGYDVSAVYDNGWPHRTAAPAKPARPSLSEAMAAAKTVLAYLEV